MTPYYADDWLTVWHGDCREVMAGMEPESVHCVVTSPPYWGLRDYGDPRQLGLEATPDEYVARLVEVMGAVRRVLRSDGTVWLNLGDCYATGAGSYRNPGSDVKPIDHGGKQAYTRDYARAQPNRMPLAGLKPKDLVGIPWRVAFALQADGWYLRSDIIWAKPNPMPESVTDRPTKSHEYIFLLSKSPRYFFDADAVREPALPASIERYKYADGNTRINKGGAYREKWNDGDKYIGVPTVPDNPAGRNIRSVWTMATQPYPGAHFATFPETLPERCIKAGTSEKGVCPECGAPWERVVDGPTEAEPLAERDPDRVRQPGNAPIKSGQFGYSHKESVGWRPSCVHVDKEWAPDGYQPSPLPPIPATVLDPFAGSGTTGMVAQSLSRRAVLIDLSLDYLGQLMARNADIPLGLGA